MKRSLQANEKTEKGTQLPASSADSEPIRPAKRKRSDFGKRKESIGSDLGRPTSKKPRTAGTASSARYSKSGELIPGEQRISQREIQDSYEEEQGSHQDQDRPQIQVELPPVSASFDRDAYGVVEASQSSDPLEVRYIFT